MHIPFLTYLISTDEAFFGKIHGVSQFHREREEEMKKHNISVAIRLRPALDREIDGDGSFHSCVGYRKGESRVYVSTKDEPILVSEEKKSTSLRRFDFDHVFDDSSSNQDVYDKLCKGVVDSAMNGINSTFFAYGQTGSGKTFSMLGSEKQKGIARLLISDLLKRSQNEEEEENDEAMIEMSYVQLYRNHINDLLSDVNENLTLDSEGEIRGLSVHKVTSLNEFNKFLNQGSKNRKTVCTKLNSSSSRSHAILTFHVNTFRGGDEEDDTVEAYRAKVHVVDLAGSERVKDSDVCISRFLNTLFVSLFSFYTPTHTHTKCRYMVRI